MKIDAKVEWKIDDEQVGVKAGDSEQIAIDADYVTADKLDVQDWIENELAEKYGRCFVMDEDFEVVNLDDVLEDLKFDEFEDKTDTGFED